MSGVCGAASAEGLASSAAVSAPTAGPATSSEGADKPLPDVEGAIGLVLCYGQDIPGSATYGASLSPVGYIRCKRLTVSSGGSGFVNRRADDLASGLGDVPTTVRLRLAGVWPFHRHWRANLGWTVDAFHRGGGNLAELGLGYERHVAPLTGYSASVRVNVAGPRDQQTCYGVNLQRLLGPTARSPIVQRVNGRGANAGLVWRS